ncbi:MAG: SusF/SusE family outer membrane protein, partial [Chryseobacterium sp.]
MKNIKNIISFIIMSLVLVSCEDKGLENADWLQDPNFPNPLTINLSSKEVVLVKENQDENAITFTWTQANDRGAGTSLTYFFRMDIAGNNFGEDITPENKTTITEEIPAGVFTKSYTVGELNALLLKNFKRRGDVITKLEVQIIAQVNNSPQFQKPEVSTSSFNVTSFSPGPLPLFMVGDAISGGWDYSTGKILPEITERTTYQFTGDFTVGSFKIIETPGSELPSYDPAVNNTIVYNETVPRTADNVFKVTKAGRHLLNMDIEKKTYNFGYFPYDKLALVGKSVDGREWNKDLPAPMTYNILHPEIFTCKVKLGLGEMKIFVNNPDWDGEFLMPVVAGTPINGNASDDKRVKYVAKGKPDDKWLIATEGDYEVTVNTLEMTI